MFNIYVVLLAGSGAVMLWLTTVRSSGTGTRALNGVFGLGFLGYAAYLAFVFDGGTYLIFFKAFILPVVMVVNYFRTRKSASPAPVEQTPVQQAWNTYQNAPQANMIPPHYPGQPQSQPVPQQCPAVMQPQYPGPQTPYSAHPQYPGQLPQGGSSYNPEVVPYSAAPQPYPASPQPPQPYLQQPNPLPVAGQGPANG